MHTFGERSCWGDLLSRLVNVPAVAVRAVAVFASSAPDEAMPSKDAIHEVQQQARAGLSTKVSGASSFTTPVGRARKDNKDLFRLGLDGQDVLWIPEQAKEMQMRLMVSVHIKDARHWGVEATLQRLQGHCYWFCMEVHVTEFVKQCLHNRLRVRKFRNHWERRCTGRDLARFFILTTCTSETAIPWVRMD